MTKFLSLVQRYRRVKRLVRLVNGLTLSGDGTGTIVIGNIRNGPFFVAFDYVLARIFSKLGFRVYLLVDDGQLAHHDGARISERGLKNSADSLRVRWEPITEDWVENVKKSPGGTLGKWLRGAVPFLDVGSRWIGSETGDVELLYYSEILRERPVNRERLEEAWKQAGQGIVSKNVDASHKRYFGGRDFDPENRGHLEYAKKSIWNEVMNESVAGYLIETIQPDLYITLDGIYTTFGTIVDAMKAHHIPVLIYQPNGFGSRMIYIGENHFGINNISRHWETFVDSGYSQGIKDETIRFMRKRLKLDEISLTEADAKWVERIREAKTAYRKAVAMFPNLTWDGAIKERDTIFRGLGDWMKETVEWVSGKDVVLIVREHPQPRHRYNTVESSLALLRELVPDVDRRENVLLISGLDPVNSYRLVESVIDCSIVYNGTLGVEIPYLGEPVIIAANSPYAYKGVGYCPASKEEYFDLVANLSRSSEDFMSNRSKIQENALRAAAYQFVYNAYYCPLMPDLGASPGFNKYWGSWDLDSESLDPIRNQQWKRTIERFLEPISGGDEDITFKLN